MIEHSKYYYDYDRNDINRKNPFKQKSKMRYCFDIDGTIYGKLQEKPCP